MISILNPSLKSLYETASKTDDSLFKVFTGQTKIVTCYIS